jgi:hypothetical protein
MSPSPPALVRLTLTVVRRLRSRMNTSVALLVSSATRFSANESTPYPRSEGRKRARGGRRRAQSGNNGPSVMCHVPDT